MRLIRVAVGLRTSRGNCHTNLGLRNLTSPIVTLRERMVALVSCIPVSKLGTRSPFLSGWLRFRSSVLITIGEGESYKSLSCCRSLIRLLHQERMRRSDAVLALGGGIVGDLSGFVTSCYMRGTGLIHLPSTLLSQTDSSLGGKTGLNSLLGKNSVGTFFFGDGILSDIALLRSLPEREWRTGLSEIIKVGACADGPFFSWLESHIQKVLRREVPTVLNLVKRSAEAKSSIVTADSTERGIRSVLNFGHTFGHAIELGLSYSMWSHGEAVSCGMMLAVRTSERLGLVTSDTQVRLLRLLSLCGLPTALPTELPVPVLVRGMWFDKKNLGTSLNIVLLRGIADPTIVPLTAERLGELVTAETGC